jgi:PH (Pleckstrin Homology) domain-containing protein
VVEAKPRRASVVAYVAAGLILVVFTLIGTALTGSTGEGTAVFRPGDQAAMIGLGICGALGALAFARPRVKATAEGIWIRNVFGTYDLPWAVVREVRFERGHPWVTLELADDDTVSVLAIQAADKEYAVAAVRGLRALHRQAMSDSRS